MSETSHIPTLPQEVHNLIWRRALPFPGIHFFSMNRKTTTEFTGSTIPPKRKDRALLPPYSRPEGGNLWWASPEDEHQKQRTGWFSGGNPSAYSTLANLRALSETSAEEVNKAFEKAEASASPIGNDPNAGWVSFLPTPPTPSPPPSTTPPSKIVLNPATDLVCIQIPNRTSHSEWFGFHESLYNLSFMGMVFSELEHLQALVVELRPPRLSGPSSSSSSSSDSEWHDDWLPSASAPQVMPGSYPRSEGEVDHVYLSSHFPSLNTVYMLDYSLRLKRGCTPCEEARRWRGGRHEFVEVRGRDGRVWEREGKGVNGEGEGFDLAGELERVKGGHVMLQKLGIEPGIEVRFLARVGWRGL